LVGLLAPFYHNSALVNNKILWAMAWAWSFGVPSKLRLEFALFGENSV
jgi:hypothetical protein